jgi:hypothetical protein
MNLSVEMGSVTMIYIPSFIKTGTAVQKLIEGMVIAEAYF